MISTHDTSLGAFQRRFTYMAGKLIGFAYSNGYELTFGEAWRTPEQAELDAQKGIGIANSLHTLRLAVDFNLFRNGAYLTDTQSYDPLGQYWELIGGSWGGRFAKPDGNHFSLEYQGVR